MSATFEQRANEKRVAYILGAASIEELIAWTDTEIELAADPPTGLLELSVGRGFARSRVIELLNQLPVNTKDLISTCRGMGSLAQHVRAGNVDVQSAVRRCYEYLRDEHLLYEDPFVELISLEDDLSLIRDGIFADDKLKDLRANFLDTLDEMQRFESE